LQRLSACALVLVVALFAVFALSAASASAKYHPSPAHHPQVGIGDDTLAMFTDPRFLALKIKNVRYDMAWDALTVPYQQAAATAWMDAAKADGLSVLVTIDHSDRIVIKKVKVHGKIKREIVHESRVMPTTAQYIKAFKAFRKQFPWVTQFVTWDETNCYCEVSFNHEGKIASYYRALRAACRQCTILAAEFLDSGGRYSVPMNKWVHTLDKDIGYQPTYWGLNNYVDANYLVARSTKQLLSLVRGKVWLAETGGIVGRAGVKHSGFPQNAKHAAKVDSFILHTLVGLSPRIQRVYLYEWAAKTNHDSWDSALISYNGIPRPGYDVLANTLSSWGIAPDCAISTAPPACQAK
jgi:hypothetical protein